MQASGKITLTLLVLIGLLLLTSGQSLANKKSKRTSARLPTRAQAKEAERRLSEMGYWTGPIDGNVDSITRTALIAFQKWEGREITGRLTRADVEAINNAPSPRPRDAGYKHVEIDVDRQVMSMIDDDGKIIKIVPVSTGSGRRYNEKGSKGLAYTPKGRFRIYGKISGWKESSLGLLYYPNYFSDGLAIHGNPSVPSQPASHGCIRVPMFASRAISEMLPVGTIVIIYDKDSFVSAKAWAEADKQNQAASVP
jgi:peptidoglycan hydrolase-like protein with peptidoglycan-binding domain